MTRELVVHRGALDEIDEAASWYEARRPGLGVEFVGEIERVTTAILELPEALPIWKPGFPYRRAVARRFPYVLFFVVDEQRVVLMAVAHAKRRPGYWTARRARRKAAR